LLAFGLLLLLTTALLTINSKVAYAQPSSAINVDVDHVITVQDGGQVTINDTVKLSSKTGEQPAPISSFNVGFPFKYGFNLDYVFAYESSNPANRLNLDLDYGLGQAGFYAVRVNFGREIDLGQMESYNFTVIFVFSNLITPGATQYLFDVDFPVYPSLAQNASSCKTTLLLPSNANFTSSPILFNQTTTGVLTLPAEPLDAFTSNQSTIRFTSVPVFYLLEANEVRREVVLDEWEELIVSDSYSITNKGVQDIVILGVSLPQDAYEVSVLDELGNTYTFSFVATKASINFQLKPFKPSETVNLQVTYRLPWKNHVDQERWDNFNLKFTLFENMNLTVRKLTVTINLPEGAEFQSSNTTTPPNVVENGAYQETPIFTFSNISSFQNLGFAITYSHVVFWAAFRPMLWTGAAVLFVGALAFLWRFLRAPAPIPTALPIRPEELQNYVKAYDEERKLMQERESLEAQARKGKIPRRLYRVRTKTLESRISVLLRDLANLREKIRAAGPRYAEMMRQIEVAETDLRGAEADIRRAEVSYRRGELSPAAYHQLLEGAYRRRDRAKTNIDGVLLRLREEIS